jgi:hypothetical protein
VHFEKEVNCHEFNLHTMSGALMQWSCYCTIKGVLEMLH